MSTLLKDPFVLALGLGYAFTVFLIAIFWLSPHALTPSKHRVLGTIAAGLGAATAVFLTRHLIIESDSTTPSQGSFIIQVIIGATTYGLVMMWWGSRFAPVKMEEPDPPRVTMTASTRFAISSSDHPVRSCSICPS